MLVLLGLPRVSSITNIVIRPHTELARKTEGEHVFAEFCAKPLQKNKITFKTIEFLSTTIIAANRRRIQRKTIDQKGVVS